jgi:hypothetical protein
MYTLDTDSLIQALQAPDSDFEKWSAEQRFEYDARHADRMLRMVLDAESEAAAIEGERKRLDERKKARERRAAWARSELFRCLEALGGKFPHPLATVSFQKRVATVRVSDVEKLPPEYVTQVVTLKPNAQAVIAAYKEHGEIVDGCEIVPAKKTLMVRK